MAKRKSEVRTKPWTATGRYYNVWIDESLEGRLKAVEGIHDVAGPLKEWEAPYYILLDPRYDADEVIAEIEALGEPDELAKRMTLQQRAESLGRDAARELDIILVALTLLHSAEKAYFGTKSYECALYCILRRILDRTEKGQWEA